MVSILEFTFQDQMHFVFVMYCCYIAQASLKFTCSSDPSALASWVLELQAHTYLKAVAHTSLKAISKMLLYLVQSREIFPNSLEKNNFVFFHNCWKNLKDLETTDRNDYNSPSISMTVYIRQGRMEIPSVTSSYS